MGVSITLAIAAPYACALIAYFVTRHARRHRRIGGVAVVTLGVLSVLAAMFVPPDAAITRGLLAVFALVLALRAYSVWFDRIDVRIASYLRFLSFGLIRPYLVYVGRSARRPRHVLREIVRFVLATTVIIVSWKFAEAIIATAPVENSWLLNHLIVLVAFLAIVGALGQASLAVWRLQGLPIRRPINDNILLSRTPADFWRRWSWPMHGWLTRYVYLPAGGRRNHVRATLAVFLISGLQHELLFYVPIGRVTGHQTIFFMLNALAVLASPALERFARRHGTPGEILVRAATIAFLAAVASLMFVSIHYVTPIYMKQIWLMW